MRNYERHYELNPQLDKRENHIEAIIFDLGAVLADHKSPRQVFQSYGMPYGDGQHDIWRKYKTGVISESRFWDEMLDGTDFENDKERMKLEVRSLFAQALPAEGYPFVADLKGKGYQVAILSNHSAEWGRSAVNALGLDKLCNPIVISAEVGMDKPNLEIYAYILRLMGRENSPESCLFIDDKLANVNAALKLGINAIQFKGGKELEQELRNYDIK